MYSDTRWEPKLIRPISYFQLLGVYHGEDELELILQPLLSQLSANATTTVKPDTYLEIERTLASPRQSLNNSAEREPLDTYYTKSIFTPAASPIRQDTATALFNYMATDGQATKLVRKLPLAMYWILKTRSMAELVYAN